MFESTLRPGWVWISHGNRIELWTHVLLGYKFPGHTYKESKSEMYHRTLACYKVLLDFMFCDQQMAWSFPFTGQQKALRVS
mmetsp:Transcript_46154/g.81231  ORF Transcript_46154/g.81231 Transcript_46154/m.81231 type:complete len:81 (-) Transcript_46154:451-693(-)